MGGQYKAKNAIAIGPPMPELTKLLRLSFIASDLGVSTATVRRYVDAGYFPPGRLIGVKQKYQVWPENEYRAWREALPVGKSAPLPDAVYEARKAQAAAKRAGKKLLKRPTE